MTTKPPLDNILNGAALMANVRAAEIADGIRRLPVVRAREWFCMAAHEAGYSYPEIAEYLVGREGAHNTARCADRRGRRKLDPETVDRVMAAVRERLNEQHERTA